MRWHVSIGARKVYANGLTQEGSMCISPNKHVGATLISSSHNAQMLHTLPGRILHLSSKTRPMQGRHSGGKQPVLHHFSSIPDGCRVNIAAANKPVLHPPSFLTKTRPMQGRHSGSKQTISPQFLSLYSMTCPTKLELSYVRHAAKRGGAGGKKRQNNATIAKQTPHILSTSACSGAS